ncbi:hypothetical protein BH23CHL8_BH23CHL8_27320 [soil metagenome]
MLEREIEGVILVGYDMFLLELPERLRPRRERYRASVACYEGLRERADDDPEKVAAKQAWLAADNPAYFRLNILGMAKIRAVMDAAGMLAWQGSLPPMPAWEHVPLQTLDGEPFHPELGYPDDRCTPEQIAYMDARDEWRRYRPGGNVGVQAWKLQSNDFWVVTAEECAEALSVWDPLLQEDQEEIVEAVTKTDIAGSDESLRFWEEALARVGAVDSDDSGPGHQPPTLMTPTGTSDDSERWLLEELAVPAQSDESGPVRDEPGMIAVTANRGEHRDLPEVWRRWLEFLRLGAETDGFMVE